LLVKPVKAEYLGDAQLLGDYGIGAIHHAGPFGGSRLEQLDRGLLEVLVNMNHRQPVFLNHLQELLGYLVAIWIAQYRSRFQDDQAGGGKP
jgi:hypothetical protein